MSSLGSETARKYIDGCTKCEEVGKSYKSQCNSANCILLHTTRCIICAGKKSGQLFEKKEKALLRLGKVVSAFRNSGGGHVLIHVVGQIPWDRCLEQFDEFITRTLSDLLDDRELYVDTYKRHWLSDLQEFKGHTDYVFVIVKETNGIATANFNTKVRNDIENISVTSASLALCMINRPNNTDTKKPKTKGIKGNIQDLHESRNNEVKRVHVDPKNDITQQISKSPSDFVDYIWHDLKLKDNLTSLSKVEGGGSYYVGISEEIKWFRKYRTKLLNIDGFCTIFKESEIIGAIKAKLESDTIALERSTFCSVPDDLIKVQLYPVPKTKKRVLEIAVRYYDGIIFNDKDGPRAYEVKDNAIHRMDKATWLGRIKAANK